MSLLADKLGILSQRRDESLDSFWRTLAWVAIWVIAFMFVGYLYRWTSLAFSHDSLYVNELVRNEIIPITLDNGRIFLAPYYLLRGGITAPLLLGVLGTIYLVFAVTFIVRLFQIENKWMIAALCGVLSVNACITLLNATYIKDFDCDMLALLFAVLGVFILDKYKYGFIGSAGLFMLSLGLYQAFIQVTLVLMLLLIVVRLLSGAQAKDVLVLGGKMIASLVTAAIAYYACLKLLRHFFSYHPAHMYNSIDNLSTSMTSSSLLRYCVQAYVRPFEYLSYPETYLPTITGALNGVLLLGTLIALVVAIVKARLNVGRIMVTSFLFAGLPIAASCTYILSGAIQHGLMIYSFNLLYVVFFVVFSQCGRILIEGKSAREDAKDRSSRQATVAKVVSCVAVLSCFVIVFGNLVYANQVSLKKDLEFEATYSAMTRIVDAMENIPTYEAGQTPVVFVGRLSENAVVAGERAGYASDRMPDDPMYATGLRDTTAVTGMFSYDYFFRNILSYPIHRVDASSLGMSTDAEERVSEMPVFPKNGFCEMIDGTLFVKLSAVT